MSNIALIWPPFEFRQRFDGFCAPFWAQLRTLTIASRNLTASRDLILPRLISGELSVATAEQELEAAA
jgi:type I restriction enzyme S subunit